MPLFERIMDTNRSFMRLPLWVRLWIVLALGGVNLGAFLLTHTPTGYWAAWCTVLVLVMNSPILLVQRGWGKALAIPHLVVWIPLLGFVAFHLGADDITSTELYYALALFTVNGTSIVFDLVDSWRWLQGERDVA